MYALVELLPALLFVEDWAAGALPARRDGQLAGVVCLGGPADEAMDRLVLVDGLVEPLFELVLSEPVEGGVPLIEPDEQVERGVDAGAGVDGAAVAEVVTAATFAAGAVQDVPLGVRVDQPDVVFGPAGESVAEPRAEPVQVFVVAGWDHGGEHQQPSQVQQLLGLREFVEQFVAQRRAFAGQAGEKLHCGVAWFEPVGE